MENQQELFSFIYFHLFSYVLLKIDYLGNFRKIISWTSFQSQLKFDDWILCHSIVGYHIATSICTCHDSTAVVPCTSCHSDHFTTTWMIAEWILHRIWITMENHLWHENLIARYKASGSLNTSSNDNPKSRGVRCHLEKMVSGPRHFLRNPLSLFYIRLILFRQDVVGQN